MRKGLTERKGDLADHPVVAFVNADAPENEADGREDRGRIDEPESHLGGLDGAGFARELDDEPIAQPAGAEDLGDESADDEAEEEQTGRRSVCEKLWVMIVGTRRTPESVASSSHTRRG